jgi:2,4-dienoyl-CoA reductase-like NADH-dependent reductase (Old Yellow Enzyme family)
LPTNSAPGVTSPLTLNCGVTLPNRLCKAAMTEGLADCMDNPTPEHNELYRQWSLGGAGLLISGNIMVDHRYLERAGNVVLENNNSLTRCKLWTAAGTLGNNQFWAQINHPGSQCPRLINAQPLAPSAVQLRLIGAFAKPRAMRTEEIQETIERFATTAKIAKSCGFNGVQIHSAHGYLSSQFLSPLTNLRNDQWGGSLANRARFLLETVAAVRTVVGHNYPVSVKLNSADFQQGGFTLEECVRVASWLGEQKIDLLEISGGTYGQLAYLDSNDKNTRESTSRREAFFLKYADVIAKAAKIPIMVTGGFRSLEVMNAALRTNKTQMIGLARPFCTDPEFPGKMFAGVIQRTPVNEHKLTLGKGYLGAKSTSSFIRTINNQGQTGWYYQQLINLAKRKQPDLTLNVLNAFTKHMLEDTRLALRRRSCRAFKKYY